MNAIERNIFKIIRAGPLKILFCIVGVALLCTLSIVVLVYTYDWNRARPFINDTISRSTGRVFAVRGDLKMQFIQAPPAQRETGWRGYLPLVLVSANDVQISNPSWSTVDSQMASARRVVFAFKPWALLQKKVVLTDLELTEPVIALERGIDGRTSWSLKDSAPSIWSVEIQRLAFAKGMIRYLDNSISLDVKVNATSIAGGAAASSNAVKNPHPIQQFGVQFTLGGTYHKAAVTGNGKVGAVLMLENRNTVYPVQADTQIGKNRIAVAGVVTDPYAPSGIDMQLTLEGASIADLYPLTGVLLPETPAYKTQGRLLGQKDKGNWNWTYQNFTGSMGGSDLAGTLEYLYRQPRALLRGVVTSNQLRLEDLGPSVGADSNAHKLARGHAPDQPNGKVLPVEQFHTEKWGALDADVKLSSKRLVRTHDIPFENIVAHIYLKDRVLSLTPLNFGMAGGDVTSHISLDGRKAIIDGQIKLAARNLKVRELFPKLQSMKASFGEVNGDAALTGHGNSISTMLATSNGEFAATVSRGSISQFLLEAAGLNVANVVFVQLFGDKQVQLNCLVSDFGVKDGVAHVRRFVVDTDNALVEIRGDIDLSREQLNLDVRPQTKGIRLFSLRTPLYARGSFASPDVGPYKGPLALKATAAVGLAFLFPAAAVLPLINPGEVSNIDCAAELAKAMQTRNAPKSEQTAAPARPVSSEDIQKIRKEK